MMGHITPIFKNLTEFQKRQLACEAHFSGAYQSICRENPMWDFSDGSGFTIRSTDRNYSDVIVKYHNLSKAQKLLLESFMEERNPPTAHTEELSECYFTPDKKTSSATICVNCGKEKMLHTIGDGLKATSIEINPKPVTEELSTPKATESESENDENIWEWAAIFYFNLKALIDLKKYKEDNGKDDYYLENQPKQWYSAQQVIDLWKKSGYGAFPASQFTPHKEGYSVEDMEGLANFIGKEDLKKYADGWCQPGGSNGFHWSTPELVTQFLNQLK